MKFILLEKKLKKVTLFSFRIFDVQQQESHLFWVHTRYTILIYVKNFTQCYRMDVLIKTGHYIDRARYMSTLWPACFRHLWAKNERIIKFRYLLDLLFTRHMICVCVCVCVRVCVCVLHENKCKKKKTQNAILSQCSWNRNLDMNKIASVHT